MERPRDRQSALAVLGELLGEIHNGQVDEWENPTLERYLEALRAWLGDCAGYYRNNFGLEVPDNGWEVICDALLAARTYE